MKTLSRRAHQSLPSESPGCSRREIAMDFQRYKYLLYSDLYRITGRVRFTTLLRYAVVGESYKYNFWMRTCAYARGKPLLKFTVYPLARLMLGHLTHKMGISIGAATSIGSGFYIGHFGGIVVNSRARIGDNCNISQGVTLGKANRGKNKGYPIIGDNVYIGPGAVVVGNIQVGNNVAIGANCVVTHDVPDHAVVVGIPGRVISLDGSEGYVNRTDYAQHLLARPPRVAAKPEAGIASH